MGAFFTATSNQCLLAPTEHTHLTTHNTENILDLVVAKDLTVSQQLYVYKDLNSDNYPVIMVIVRNPISKDPRQVLNY